MNEIQWAKTVKKLVSQFFTENHPHLDILQGAKLPYANEVLEYQGNVPKEVKPIPYETDLLITHLTQY